MIFPYSITFERGLMKILELFIIVVYYYFCSCFSYLGKSSIPGPQGFSLAPTCFLTPETVIHELGHAIGLFHEHTRPDRNESIRVNYNNIRPGTDLGQFHILEGVPSINTQGLPYDYNSIMHYGGYQSAKNLSLPTIEALDPNIIVGKAVELSPLDIIRVNKYYKCKRKSNTFSLLVSYYGITVFFLLCYLLAQF